MSRGSQHYQLQIDGPQTDFDPALGERPSDRAPERIRASYASPDTAVGRARYFAASRAHRGPASHVRVIDKRVPDAVPLYEWHGPATAEGIAAGGEPVVTEQEWRQA